MKKKIIGIIQARVNSTRLEKKMLLPIGNHNLIEWVIKRIKKTKRLDEIILATTKKNEDNILIDISKKIRLKHSEAVVIMFCLDFIIQIKYLKEIL